MIIGYARVSAVHQSLDRQIEVLEKLPCDRIYQEKISGKNLKDRPQLEKAIKSLGTGDTFVIAEWDRATRSLYDGIEIMRRIHDMRASIRILDKPHLDLSTAIGQGFLAFLSALAQDERERILRRTSAGRKLAMENGVQFGRKPKLSAYQLDLAKKMREDGKTLREIGTTFNVHYSTIAKLQ